MAFGWGARFKSRPACRFMARLTLFLFALRAIVPVGFMPDLGALGHGEVRDRHLYRRRHALAAG